MFTGLVAGKGIVRGLEHGRVEVETPLAGELEPGDSIAVNGVCLTATGLDNGSFAAEVMPETISHEMPAAASTIASSPPRPNTNGSPPFNRAMRLPSVASRTSRSLVYSCGTPAPGRLPTSISSPRASSRMPGGIRRSWRITSAAAISSRARTVSRPGSPGPAPTR